MKSNQSTWYSELDLVRIIYTETPEQLWKAAARNVSQHLRKLEKQKLIQSKDQELEDGSIRSKWKFTS